jgi:concanavalin A-like lectin/glucanase superfamily protein
MRMARMTVGLAVAIFLAVAVPAGAQILPAGIWSLNEGTGSVAHDSSGHHEDGALQGNAQWTQGRFQRALAFDGNSAAVDVPASPALQSAAVSVSAWVNSATGPGDFKYVVAQGASGCSAASYALYTGASGGLEFYASTNQGLSWTLSPDAGQGIWNGQWHHVMGTYDGANVRLYIDGKQVGSGTPDTAPIGYALPTSNDLLIGNYGGCSGLDFHGAIDDVKVFSRTLGPLEIFAGYQLSRLVPAAFPSDLVF